MVIIGQNCDKRTTSSRTSSSPTPPSPLGQNHSPLLACDSPAPLSSWAAQFYVILLSYIRRMKCSYDGNERKMRTPSHFWFDNMSRMSPAVLSLPGNSREYEKRRRRNVFYRSHQQQSPPQQKRQQQERRKLVLATFFLFLDKSSHALFQRLKM